MAMNCLLAGSLLPNYPLRRWHGCPPLLETPTPGQSSRLSMRPHSGLLLWRQHGQSGELTSRPRTQPWETQHAPWQPVHPLMTKGHLKCYKRFLIQFNSFFLFIKKSWKSMVSTNFNIPNQRQISKFKFLKDHVTLNIGETAAWKIIFAITVINHMPGHYRLILWTFRLTLNNTMQS